MTGFDPIAFLERAVAIPSHESVEEMRTMLVEVLREHDIEVTVDSAGNVLAHRGATGSARPHLVLNTHIDTVPPHVAPERRDGRLHGRGACDAKGPLAAMLAAFLAIDPAGGRTTLAVTPDEERQSTGAAALEVDPDAVIVGEPTALHACHAARGRFQGTITVDGEAAHAAEPDAGVNAILGAGRVLGVLARFDAEHPAAPDPDPDLGAPTLTPTEIAGGSAANQVPERCQITVDRRSVPPETADGFASGLNQFLDRSLPDVSAEYRHADRPTPFLEAFRTDPAADIVRALVAAGAGEPTPFGAATEASYFAAEAPTVVFGPGSLVDDRGAVAHARREYVDIEAVDAATTILETAIEGYLESG